jgi:hypothetical protein
MNSQGEGKEGRAFIGAKETRGRGKGERRTEEHWAEKKVSEVLFQRILIFSLRPRSFFAGIPIRIDLADSLPNLSLSKEAMIGQFSRFICCLWTQDGEGEDFKAWADRQGEIGGHRKVNG